MSRNNPLFLRDGSRKVNFGAVSQKELVGLLDRGLKKISRKKIQQTRIVVDVLGQSLRLRFFRLVDDRGIRHGQSFGKRHGRVLDRGEERVLARADRANAFLEDARVGHAIALELDLGADVDALLADLAELRPHPRGVIEAKLGLDERSSHGRVSGIFCCCC